MKIQSHKLIANHSSTHGHLLLITPALAAAAPARVAILPFDVNAEKDMTFLQEGIMDMLGSRLAWRDKVAVISKNETKAALATVEGFDGESRALLVGGKLQADFVLFGSLTVFGESVSIDAKMADVSGQQPPLPFFAQTRGMGEVIPQINQFATNINATVFGRDVAERPAAVQAGTAPAAGVQPAPPVYDPRMHPEKLLQSGVGSETQVPVAGQPYHTPNPAFIAAAPAATMNQTDSRSFWKSRNYKHILNDITVGDIDQDGSNEIIVASDDTVYIYRKVNNVLDQVAEIKPDGLSNILDLSIGDVNGNQIPEIFISGLSTGRNRAFSSVYEYTNDAYLPVVEKAAYYFNALTTTDGETHLFGQKQLTGSSDVDSSPIFEMVWDNGQYRQAAKALEDNRANVLSLAYGRLTPGDAYKLIVFDREDRIRIYDANTVEKWRGSKRYGGSQKFFLAAREDSLEMENRKYFPLADKSGGPG